METIFENSKSLAVGQDWFQANNAFLISFNHALSIPIKLVGSLSLNVASHSILKSFGPHGLRVCILAIAAVAAVPLKEVLAYCPIGVVFQKIVYYIVVIF
jgi:hypothetical protein